MQHRMLLLFILALLPLVFPACRMQETGGEDVIVEEIHYQLFSEAPLDLSDPFFQGKLDTISLDPEGPEDFSVSNADKVVVFGNRIYILDEMFRRIAVYDLTGHVLSRIGRIGRGPEEYLRISDFCVSKDGSVWLVDGSTDKLFHYSSDGVFLSKNSLKTEIGALQKLPGEGFLMGVNLWDDSSYKDYHVLLCDSLQRITAAWVTREKEIDPDFTFPSVGFCEGENGFDYMIPLMDEIYEFDTSGTYIHKYLIDFGPFALSKDARQHVENHLEETLSCVFLALASYVDNNYLISGIRDRGTYRSLIADRKSMTRYMTEDVLGLFLGVSDRRAVFMKQTKSGMTLTLVRLTAPEPSPQKVGSGTVPSEVRKKMNCTPSEKGSKRWRSPSNNADLRHLTGKQIG